MGLTRQVLFKKHKNMPLNYNFILNHFPNKPTPNMLQGNLFMIYRFLLRKLSHANCWLACSIHETINNKLYDAAYLTS